MDLLIPLQTSAWDAFTNRATSDYLRLGLTLAALLGIGGILLKSVGIWAGLIGGLGAGWLVWQLFNFFTQDSTPLFLNEPSLGELPDFLFGSGWQQVVAVATIGVLLFSTLVSTKKTNVGKNGGGNENVPLVTRIISLASIWVGVMLLVGVINQFYLTYFG